MLSGLFAGHDALPKSGQVVQRKFNTDDVLGVSVLWIISRGFETTELAKTDHY